MQGRWSEAEKTYSLLLRLTPDNFSAHLHLATVLPHLGRNAEAVTHLQAAMTNCPDAADALNNLAWALATSGDGELRDGAEAVKRAERACEMTHYQETIMVGTLAAAYAEAGRFDDAVATAQKACALATRLKQPELLERNQELLALYRQHEPYHEPAPPGARPRAERMED
jgi:Flp pilus assembly protein TadD